MSATVSRSGRGASPAANAAAGLAMLMFAASLSPSAHSGSAAPSTPCSTRKSLAVQTSSVPGGATSAAIASSIWPKPNGGAGLTVWNVPVIDRSSSET